MTATKRSVVRTLATTDQSGSLLLRIPLGIIFIAHGAQKLFGAFGGYGLEGTGQWMDSIGLTPGYGWRYWRAARNSSVVSPWCWGC